MIWSKSCWQITLINEENQFYRPYIVSTSQCCYIAVYGANSRNNEDELADLNSYHNYKNLRIKTNLSLNVKY